MLCSRLLKPIDHHEKHNFLLRSFEWSFNKVASGYAWALKRTVALPRLVLAITLGTFVLTGIMFQAIPKGFFPTEDIGQLSGSTVGPDDASFDAMVARQSALAEIVKRDPDVLQVISTVGGGNAANTVNSGRLFIMLRDKPERKDNVLQVMARLRRSTSQVPGINVFFQPVQSINIGTTQTRAQYQFGMRSSDLAALRDYAPRMEERMRRIPSIMDVNSDLQIKARSTVIDVDRDTASRLGLSVDQIRLLLYSAFGSRQVSTIYASDDTYQVILEADPRYADVNEVLRRMQIRTPSGGLVPLDTVAKRSDKPTSLTVNHIAQLPSVIISFNLAPGIALGAGRSRHHRGRVRDRLAQQHHHQLRGQRPGLPAGGRQPGHAALRGGAGDLHHPRHPLRKLHPSADHPVGSAVGRHRRAGHPHAVQHGPQRHRHDRRRHADRHRQEERHHDGRLRDRAPRAGRLGRSRRSSRQRRCASGRS